MFTRLVRRVNSPANELTWMRQIEEDGPVEVANKKQCEGIFPPPPFWDLNATPILHRMPPPPDPTAYHLQHTSHALRLFLVLYASLFY